MHTKESASKHGSPSFPRLRRYLSIYALLVAAALLESGWLTGCDVPEEPALIIELSPHGGAGSR
jgi:hypothetical protein